MGLSCLLTADCGALWGCGAVDCVETEAIDVSKVREVVGVIGLVG